MGLFLHAEADGVDGFFPHDFEGAGVVGVFVEGKRELVDGSFERAFGQRHAGEVVFLVHGDAPFADIRADRELGGAGLGGDEIKRVGAGGHGRLAKDEGFLREQ